MGLLDEAIKDHLELKRRHGADPGEVARLEHEALGPARREPAEAPPVADEPAAETPEATAEPAPAPPQPYDDERDDDEVPADERLDAPFDHAAHAPQQPRREVVEAQDDEPQAAAAPSPTVDQPTRQFSVEELEEASRADVVPADEEPDGEDVLEETPEFLQETPEHDRLWFEQKPPRDFDF